VLTTSTPHGLCQRPRGSTRLDARVIPEETSYLHYYSLSNSILRIQHLIYYTQLFHVMCCYYHHCLARTLTTLHFGIEATNLLSGCSKTCQTSNWDVWRTRNSVIIQLRSCTSPGSMFLLKTWYVAMFCLSIIHTIGTDTRLHI
jgi:hypothetical protein